MPTATPKLVIPLLLGAGLLAAGCDNPCDEAIDLLRECGADSNRSALNTCDEYGECYAACVEARYKDCSPGGTTGSQATWAYSICVNDCRP